jgi:CRISPR-associated endonuclease/helicase Cas3
VLRFRNKTTTPKKETNAVSYTECPAKTFEQKDGSKVTGQTVFNHCQIVGEVAKELIQRFPLPHLFPKGAAFAAANHDIGKVSPTFYNKIHTACNKSNSEKHYPLIAGFNAELESRWGGHAGVSQVSAAAMRTPRYLPEILGQHHGFSPNVSTYSAEADVFGGKAWQKERENLVKALESVMNETWPEITSPAQARLVAGLTSVADWIGSGYHFDNPDDNWKPKIQRAIDEAGFIPPLYKTGLSFEQLFGFQPRKVQEQLIEQASKPGVYVLEAPMGVGKTEAALYVAYQMLAKGKASGVYFALPTQLTSNKIYERFNQFLSGILFENCPFKEKFLGALLLHTNAWLVDTEMGEEGRPGGAWFNQNKRGLLAPFAVGTIDQALMAAMSVKHGFVRAFGLAGKVVILDEVHTYDAYTGTLLDALINLLKELHCTVIVLSATLNQERRQSLLGHETKSVDYPLITAMPKDASQVVEVGVPSNERQQVFVRLQESDKDAIEEALLRSEQGQQVLWIENTVKEAQEAYLNLAARAMDLGVDCGLIHSRFTQVDRKTNEEKWVNLYGKNGHSKRSLKGRILVGTQVLEQSLDIDSDFLISRFAPTDMLLQRFGRLWRHAETPRNQFAKQEAWLLAPELKAAIKKPHIHFGSSVFVYSPYVLCRSLEVWQNVKNVILPKDIRTLIDATYKDRVESDEMARWKRELFEGNRDRKGVNALKQLARIGLAEIGNTLPEDKAQTRYSETDSFEVLLLRNATYEKTHSTLTLLNGERVILPKNRTSISRKEWRDITVKLMEQLVYVHPQEAPKEIARDRLERLNLQSCFYLGSLYHQSDASILRVALVDDSELLKGIGNTSAHEKYSLEYRADIGYRMIKE